MPVVKYTVKATPWTGESVARGVFASADIERGELVEAAHCLFVPQEEYNNHFRRTVLEHYLFRAPSGDHLLALGVGSLFNHSAQPNLDYRIDAEALVVRFYAARPVLAGEELTIYYGCKLWFVDGKAKPECCVHKHMDSQEAFLAAIDL